MPAIVASHLMSNAHAAKSGAPTSADPASDAFATILALLDDGTAQDASATTDGDTKLAANDGSKSIDALLKPSDTTDPAAATPTTPAPTETSSKTLAQPILPWRAAELDADKATNDNDGSHVHADRPKLKGDVTDADVAGNTDAKTTTPASDILSRFAAPADPSALKPSEDVKPGNKSDDTSKTGTQHATLRSSDDNTDRAVNAALLLQPAQTPAAKPVAISTDGNAVIRSGEDITPASAPVVPATPSPKPSATPVAPQAADDDAQTDDIVPATQPVATKPTSAKPSDKTPSQADTNRTLQDLSESQASNDPITPPAPASGDTKTPAPAAHTQPHATTATAPAADAPATPAQTAQAQSVQQNQPAANPSAPQPNHTDANAASAVAAPTAPAPVAAPQAQLQLHAQLQASNTDATPNLPALAVQIATHSDDGQKHFNIRLDPPELGRVDVHMTVDDQGKAQATLSVEKPQTLALLQKDAPELQRQLKDAGLDLSQNGLNFSLRQQQQNAGNSDGNANGSR
ncbi:MAG TPA: flagellar hook-length control protein FliK, partial [Rhizomicrobium sp.]|nr:flagellar hook-length control protein FliK [Rhizomicrobium sp.]